MGLVDFKTTPLYKDHWFNSFLNDSFFDGKAVSKKAACDISEDKEHFYCDLDLPGYKKEDIKISLDDGILTISGQAESKKAEDKTYHLEERFTSSFKRSFSLPKSIETDKINAKYEAGVLHITLPKAQVEAPKMIGVN